MTFPLHECRVPLFFFSFFFCGWANMCSYFCLETFGLGSKPPCPWHWTAKNIPLRDQTATTPNGAFSETTYSSTQFNLLVFVDLHLSHLYSLTHRLTNHHHRHRHRRQIFAVDLKMVLVSAVRDYISRMLQDISGMKVLILDSHTVTTLSTTNHWNKPKAQMKCLWIS